MMEPVLFSNRIPVVKFIAQIGFSVCPFDSGFKISC